jgi:hypothetical protein
VVVAAAGAREPDPAALKGVPRYAPLTHPEWEEDYLERMTKRCMDDRLLRQSVR